MSFKAQLITLGSQPIFMCEKMFYQVAIQNITHVIFIFLYLAETIPIYIMLHHEAETLPVYIVYQTFILFYPVYIAGHV